MFIIKYIVLYSRTYLNVFKVKIVFKSGFQKSLIFTRFSKNRSAINAFNRYRTYRRYQTVFSLNTVLLKRKFKLKCV